MVKALPPQSQTEARPFPDRSLAEVEPPEDEEVVDLLAVG